MIWGAGKMPALVFCRKMGHFERFWTVFGDFLGKNRIYLIKNRM